MSKCLEHCLCGWECERDVLRSKFHLSKYLVSHFAGLSWIQAMPKAHGNKRRRQQQPMMLMMMFPGAMNGMMQPPESSSEEEAPEPAVAKAPPSAPPEPVPAVPDAEKYLPADRKPFP